MTVKNDLHHLVDELDDDAGRESGFRGKARTWRVS
jgi:hypothetical protein